MTTIEEAIFSKLTSEPAVTNLVGTRVYPSQLPQNPTYPAVVYRRVSTQWPYDLSGPGNMGFPRFQFDCYGLSYGSVKGVAQTLRLVLSGFAGSVDGVEICGIWFLSEVDGFDPVADVDRVAVDFRVSFRE